MLEQLEQTRQDALSVLDTLAGSDALKSWNSQYLGKSGAITTMLRQVGQLSREERPAFGKRGCLLAWWNRQTYFRLLLDRFFQFRFQLV